jgi:hypothetical protein
MTKSKVPTPRGMAPHFRLSDNLSEVGRLIEIHEQLVGSTPGHKYKVEVLNKSAVVLIAACWESFIEDLASSAFDHSYKKAQSHADISAKVLGRIGKKLLESKSDLAPWQLAGEGWKTVMAKHKGDVVGEYLSKLNSPSPKHVADLFESLIGIRDICSSWHWPGMKQDQAANKLTELCKLRGDIAHRVAASKKVYKKMVLDYRDFISHLSVVTSNHVRDYLRQQSRIQPWPYIQYIKAVEPIASIRQQTDNLAQRHITARRRIGA